MTMSHWDLSLSWCYHLGAHNDRWLRFGYTRQVIDVSAVPFALKLVLELFTLLLLLSQALLPLSLRLLVLLPFDLLLPFEFVFSRLHGNLLDELWAWNPLNLLFL